MRRWSLAHVAQGSGHRVGQRGRLVFDAREFRTDAEAQLRARNGIYLANWKLRRNEAAADAFGKVPFKVSFSSYPDETSELCDLVLPDHHPLEAWGDARTWDSGLIGPDDKPRPSLVVLQTLLGVRAS